MSSLLTIPTFFLCGPALPPSSPHALDKLVLRLNWKILRSPRCRTRSPITLLETWRALSIVLSFTGDWVPTKQDREVRTRISGMSSDHTLPSARNNARTDGVAATGCGKLSRWRNRSSFSLLIARHSGLPSLEACDSSWGLKIYNISVALSLGNIDPKYANVLRNLPPWISININQVKGKGIRSSEEKDTYTYLPTYQLKSPYHSRSTLSISHLRR